MQGPRTQRMPSLAVLSLAGLLLATPLSAQQRGRMQVHATVVDVSSSLDVLAMLKQRAERGRPLDQGRVAPAPRTARTWFLVAEERTAPVMPPQDEALERRETPHGVTIFYY